MVCTYLCVRLKVLAADCPIEWVKCNSQSEKLPTGAVQGGHTEDGTPLYVGHAEHRDTVTCGKVLWPMKVCHHRLGTERLFLVVLRRKCKNIRFAFFSDGEQIFRID